VSRIEPLDSRTYERALSCVHCGLCLPVCPTYLQTGLEAEGPRGRIQLMRGLSDGVIGATEAVRGHLDSCLDCRACESACPSNVIYHELIEGTREKLVQLQSRGSRNWLINGVIFHILPYPIRLKLALFPVRVLQRVGVWKFLDGVLPGSLRKLSRMLPESGEIWPTGLPANFGAKDAQLTVGFFGGCVGSVMFADVNRKAVQLLAACGVKVVAPAAQGCCGALHHHGGRAEAAREMARRNIDLFLPKEKGEREKGLDFIVTAIAGCGAMLKEYDWLLRDDAEYRERAKEFVRRVRDIHQLLAELPLPLPGHEVKRTVTYHDACHLVHGQQVWKEPRELLGRIRGLKVVSMAQSEMCCGAAGTYNLMEPAMAEKLADEKLNCIASTKAEVVAMGNAGCALHLAARAAEKGLKIQIVHPVELIHAGVFGDDLPSL
jgi:glycolate oxidase iron-sulfur subunit